MLSSVSEAKRVRILHLVRSIEDERVSATAAEQQRLGHEVTLLLMHDAVFAAPHFSGTVLACQDDLEARQAEGKHTSVDYDGIVKLIFEYDKVISW